MRPKIKLPLTIVDKVLIALALLTLLCNVFYTLYNYNKLPYTIAIHFNGSGIADGFGTKNNLFVLSVIGIIIFILFSVLSKYPHIHNYPVNINTANAAYYYNLSVKMLRILNVIIQVLFFYISYSTLQVAFKNATTINSTIIFIIVGLILSCTFYSMYKMFTYKEKH